MSFDKLYYKGKEVKEYRADRKTRTEVGKFIGNKKKYNLWKKLNASKNIPKKSKKI